MTKSTTAEPHATAFHEAGHAVIAYLQRVPFKQVIIVADADSVGHVILGKWPDWANPESSNYRERAAFDWFQRKVHVDLAGQIAETHFLGRRPPFGMHPDNCNAADGALHPCRGAQETATALLKWLYLDTRDRLINPLAWSAVEALDPALIERQMLRASACS